MWNEKELLSPYFVVSEKKRALKNFKFYKMIESSTVDILPFNSSIQALIISLFHKYQEVFQC